jgi:hypothetical protein
MVRCIVVFDIVMVEKKYEIWGLMLMMVTFKMGVKVAVSIRWNMKMAR